MAQSGCPCESDDAVDAQALAVVEEAAVNRTPNSGLAAAQDRQAHPVECEVWELTPRSTVRVGRAGYSGDEEAPWLACQGIARTCVGEHTPYLRVSAGFQRHAGPYAVLDSRTAIADPP